MTTYSCPPCWTTKRSCRRTIGGCCRRCNAIIRAGVEEDSQGPSKYAQPLYNAAVYEQLYKGAPPRSLSSLDNQGHDFSTLTISINTSIGNRSTVLLQITGLFAQNQVLSGVLDQFIRQNFSARLQAERQEFDFIPDATLIGGYLFLLCSSTGSIEQVQTIRDGHATLNEYLGYNLGAHFKYFLVCRLGTLVDNVLNGIRMEDPTNAYQSWCSNAYAAAAISHCEINYFRAALRYGHLQNCLAQEFKAFLLNWLASIEAELLERIVKGCGRFPRWRSPIKGSLRKSRRHAETYTATMQLTLHTFTSNNSPSPGSELPDANLGGGSCMSLETPISQPDPLIYYEPQPFLPGAGDAMSALPLIQPSDGANLTSHPSPQYFEWFPVMEMSTASFSPPPSHHDHHERGYDYGSEDTNPLTTLDPRYLSVNDWYSGHTYV